MNFNSFYTRIGAGLVAFTASINTIADPGVTDAQILLGQSCALKGPASGLGEGMKDGLNVYFDAINAEGGINGRKIVLKSVNDGYEPAKAEKTTAMLIDKLQVFALIGEVGTPTSKVAVPIAEAAEVPFLAPFTGAEFLRNPYKPYVVNVRGSYYQEMETLAQLLVDGRGLKKIACFYQNDGYGQAGLSGIKIALEKRGLELAAEGTYERNTTAIAQGVSAIESSQPDAVIMVGAYKPCAAFIKAAKGNANFANTTYCNISFVGTKNLLSELGDAAGEDCVVSQVVPYPWDTSVPLVAEYQAKMKAAGKEDGIGFISLEGYMAAKLFHMAAAGIEGEPTRQALLDQLKAQGTFDLGGINLVFGENDHQGMDTVFLTQFKGGKVVPMEASTGVAAVQP